MVIGIIYGFANFHGTPRLASRHKLVLWHTIWESLVDRKMKDTSPNNKDELMTTAAWAS